MRLEMNYRVKKVKKKNPTDTWRLNNLLLCNQETTEEVQKEIKRHLGKKKMTTKKL